MAMCLWAASLESLRVLVSMVLTTEYIVGFGIMAAVAHNIATIARHTPLYNRIYAITSGNIHSCLAFKSPVSTGLLKTISRPNQGEKI